MRILNVLSFLLSLHITIFLSILDPCFYLSIAHHNHNCVDEPEN